MKIIVGRAGFLQLTVLAGVHLAVSKLRLPLLAFCLLPCHVLKKVDTFPKNIYQV
jgi:hypothetical protein